ncbi:MAG: BamA/TamA family outer membrane protein [Burkholderiaceae bacterium]|jgi:translocation and assembly module TamA|nr:BamA/TamA family outer membrane protein [Burkholderiaceae bacterium]
MRRLRLFLPLSLCCALLAGCADWGGGAGRTPDEQGTQRNAHAADGEPAFDIRVECADAPLRDLVTRFNDLQRYRAVEDLETAELERLMVLAKRQVRELLATQGYFSPQVTVRREGGTPSPLPPPPLAGEGNDTAQEKIAPPPLAGEGLGRGLVVVIAITPGAVTVVGQAQVDFAGDIAASANPDAVVQRTSIAQGWALAPGKPFTQTDWSAAKTAALRALVERRYPRGHISASRADVNTPDARANLAVTLDSGPPFYLGAATVGGARRYPADLPQRLSWLKPGDVYDQQKLVDAQQRLAASGYYDSAYVSIDPDTATPDATPVHYSVTEAKRYKLQLGVGYSTDSGPRASMSWRDNTFAGTSWRNDTQLRIDPKEPLLETGLTSLPDADGWRWNALARVMRLDDGQLTTNAQTLRAGRMQSAPQYERSIYLQYDNAVVTGSGAASNVLVGDGAAASVNWSWTGRYFDSLTLPRRGFGLAGELGLGMTTKGKSEPFTRLSGRWLGVIPVHDGAPAGGSRIALRTELGAIFANASARVPATYLWRTGGDTTVRGYSYRSIGVPLQAGVIAPGRYLAVGSIEYQRPILQQRLPGLLEHVLFIDAGDVANHADDLRPRVGVGTGLRLITPAGPMELDVAYGLKVHQFRLHMNVGFTF